MKKEFWSSAALDGLLLALVCIVMTLIEAAKLNLGTAINIVLQIGQIVATIWMLLYFMKRYGAEQEQYPYSSAFKYGFLTSLCSNVIILAYMLLHYTLIFPDAMSPESIVEAIQQYSPNADISLYESLAGYMPLIAAFGAFIMYTIWAAIISAILASFAKRETSIFQTEEE